MDKTTRYVNPEVYKFLAYYDLFIAWIIDDIQDNVENLTKEEVVMLWEVYKSYYGEAIK
jgi:hypothetical protein